MNTSPREVVRELHLYLGLFVSPFVLLFAGSVFFLVHAWLPKVSSVPVRPRAVSEVPLPSNLAQLSGRARIDALKPALERISVQGEVGWVEYHPKENRLVVPVTVPGRETTVTIDLARKTATVEERTTGLADAVVVLHKSPGPHLVELRMNWLWMRVWGWFTDATVYLILLISGTGVCLWYTARAERRIGTTLLAAGAVSFLGTVYALVH